ncbi:MAG TPA: response regulator [Vicinamibacterales bacterium]|jgi:signal transduction histidine kinase/CheY-like chemotaxis protein/HAMP domain-containing protein/HPt (histidine-containing phosphotransfer) domain-containing protein
MQSPTPPPRRRRLGILARTALVSWLGTLVSLVLFIAVIIPAEKAVFLRNLESKATGISASLQSIAASSAVSEDFTTVVDYCTTVLRHDPSIRYLVLTRRGDGFSLVHRQSDWHEDRLDGIWRPTGNESTGVIRAVPTVDGQVYHYTTPFAYSGIAWGWIHIGLSLDAYDDSVAALYRRTALAALFCVLVALVASYVYARQLTNPILSLQDAVQQVARGDLSVAVSSTSRDEVGDLARSFHQMTQSLVARDRVLHSVRFAAEQFLAADNWRDAADSVLESVGSALGVDRLTLFEILDDDQHNQVAAWRVSWARPGMPESPSAGATVPLRALQLDTGETAHGATTCHAAPGPIGSGDSPDVLAMLGARSLLPVPVMVGGRCWGALTIVDAQRERTWSDTEVSLLRATADTLGSAIERQRAREALVITRDAAESASRAKSQFLANMSHEIRTPINGVMGMLHLLQRTTMTPRQERYAANALSSAQALLSVVGEVLDFSKIEAGRLELEAAVFSVPEVMDRAVRIFAGKADEKSLELAYLVDDDVPADVIGDADRLSQILINLVGNAMKFTSRGEVVARVRADTLTADAVRLRFEVRDTGCGVPPEQQAIIFDSFSQGDASMTRAHGGTGLGLTISRELCRLMDGEIGVQSEVGRGSTFWFTATFRPAASSVSRRQLVQPVGLPILIVDDSAPSRETVRECVVSWKGRPEEAANAPEALVRLRTAAAGGQPFRVVVIDWQMPGQDGLALARTIRAEPELGNPGLILLSSFSRLADHEDAAADLFSGFLAKPIRRSDLYNAIVRAANHQPAALHTTRPAIRQARVVAAGSRAATVILAEDNEVNQEFAAEVLAELGYQCIRVRNGRDALEAAQRDGADIVLMDCQMPEMDGYEASRQIRAWEASTGRPRMPIVALTAHAMSGDRDRCLQAGMDDYLSKPLEPERLADAVSKWVVRPAQLAPTVAPTALPGIDDEELLRRCMNKRPLADRLVRKFAEQAAGDLRELAAGIMDGDADSLRATSHRLKGAAANVAAAEIRTLAARVEDLARRHDLAGIAPLYQDLVDRVGVLASVFAEVGFEPVVISHEERS